MTRILSRSSRPANGGANRPHGAAQRAATLARWTIQGIRREFAGRPTAELLQQADDLAHLPLPLRIDCWGWLGALALELGERAVAAEAGQDGGA